MSSELRERTILPILIPVCAIILTEIFVFSLSRILLATGKFVAVGIALGTALAILIGAAAVATRPRVRTSTMVGALAVLFIAAIAAGAVGLQRGPKYEKEAAASRPKVQISAKNVAFSAKSLKLG